MQVLSADYDLAFLPDTGSKEGLADAALFPTLTFCRHILPSIFGWDDLFQSRPNLGKYWSTMEADPHAAKVSCQHHTRTLSVSLLDLPCDNQFAAWCTSLDGAARQQQMW